MDEMKLNLSTKIMRAIVAKIITKTIKKKLGYKINIQLNELSAELIDGEVHVHTNVDAELGKDDFSKLIKSLSKEEEP